MSKSIKSQSVITGERLTEIETTLKYQAKSIEENKLENKEEHCEIKKLLKDFIDSADKKYATKEEVQTIKDSVKETHTDYKELKRDYLDLAIKVGTILALVALTTKGTLW